MTPAAEYNKLNLSAYPDYNCFALDVKGNYRPTQDRFDNGVISISWMWSWSNPWNLWYSGTGIVVPKGSMHSQLSTCLHIEQKDNLVIHPSVCVPKKLISRGTPINDKSVDVPTKIVIPQNFWPYVHNKYHSITNAVILVNEVIKTVFIVDAYVYGSEKVGGTEQQWVLSIVKNTQLYKEFGDALLDFKMPYGTKEFSVFFNMSGLDATIASGMLPKNVVAYDIDLETGIEPITVDLLYSVYMMLESPDNQIVETAYNMLAQSKFNERKELIRWILKPYRRNASAYRNKSTAFRWLYDSCECYSRSSTTINAYDNRKMAKELLNKITKGDIYWDNDNNMVTADPKWLEDPHLLDLIQAVK